MSLRASSTDADGVFGGLSRAVGNHTVNSLPLPTTEWHSEHFWSANTFSPFALRSCAAPFAANPRHNTAAISPARMVHDPRMGGLPRARRLFALLERQQPPNEMVFELYYPAGHDFFEMVARSVPTWSIEITSREMAVDRIRCRAGRLRRRPRTWSTRWGCTQMP